MPCGTGKSLAAFWIAQALGAKTVVVAVPSLALIRQSVADWTREFLARGHVPDWTCVCSDETVGNLERDEFVGEVYDLGLPTHTDPKEIARRLLNPSKGSKIAFTTYQSSDSSPRLRGWQISHSTLPSSMKRTRRLAPVPNNLQLFCEIGR
jgi:predicted helicase